MTKFIPKTLRECISYLIETAIEDNQLEKFKSIEEEDICSYHHGLGQYIRNHWGLWEDSQLKQYFNKIGIKHPDDMSGIILTSFWRYLNKYPIKLKEQVKFYKDYWKE